MRYFKVHFSCWVDTSEPGFNGQQEIVEEAAKAGKDFFVENETLEKATEYAKTFEGISTNAFEGLGSLLKIEEITQAQTKGNISNLAVYTSYR